LDAKSPLKGSLLRANLQRRTVTAVAGGHSNSPDRFTYDDFGRWSPCVIRRALRSRSTASSTRRPGDCCDPEKPLGARERDSMLKLIISTAIKGYGYDPRAGRSGIPRQIADDLRLAGLALDEDTIRKYLNEAKELWPGPETEQKA
jgi:hypothetical protein